MTKFHKNSILVFLAVLILMLGTQVALAAAGTLNLWGIRWQPEQEVTVLIKPAKRVSSLAVNDVTTAVANWNTALSTRADQQAPSLRLVEDQKRADIVIRMRVGGGRILGSASAKTVSRFSRDIERVAIDLSGKAMGQSISRAGIRNIARHEMGHALGLGHTDVTSDLMYAYADPNTPDDTWISDCDIKGIDAIYTASTGADIPEYVDCN